MLLSIASVIRRFSLKSVQKNLLLLFLDEVNKNVERYYVAEQRQFVSEPFEIDAWKEAVVFVPAWFSREIRNYGNKLQDFNMSFWEMKNFEEMYSSSVEYKTRKNAEILHQKKELVQEKFEDLRSLVFLVQESTRRFFDSNLSIF